MAHPTLLSLEGRAPTEAMLADWKLLAGLPQRALHNLWELLLPSLERSPDAELEQRAGAFCRLYDVAPPVLQAVLRACRHVLNRAASLDLSAEQLARDLAVLCGEREEAAVILLSGYETARRQIRRNLVQQSLLDHGSVLVGLDWRVDQLRASDRGVGLDQQVALVTLRTRKQGRDKTTTFYAVPDVVRQIKLACERIEAQLATGKPPEASSAGAEPAASTLAGAADHEQ